MLSTYVTAELMLITVESIFVDMSPYHLFISLSVSVFLVFSSVLFYNIFKPHIDVYSSSNVMSIDDLIGAEIGGTLGEMIRDKEYDDDDGTSKSTSNGSTRITQENGRFNSVLTQLNTPMTRRAVKNDTLFV